MRRLIMGLAISLVFTSLGQVSLAQTGRVFPSEIKRIKDSRTGRQLTVLTNGTINDSKLYPTDQQWAFDRQHIIFRSAKRASDGFGQIFAIHQETGDITQLTQGPGVHITSIMVSRTSNGIYYLRTSAPKDR